MTYVLPIISDTIQIRRDLLINGYLRTKSFFNPEYFFLEFKHDDEYAKYLEGHIQVVELSTQNGNLLAKIRLNSVQREINKLYLQGKYSKFPSFYKEKILKYYNLPKNSQHYQILYKLPILKYTMEKDLNVKLDDSSELGIKTNIIEETLQ